MTIEVRWKDGVCSASFVGRTDIMAEIVGHGRDPKSAVGDLCELSRIVRVVVSDDNMSLGEKSPGLEEIMHREKGERTPG